MRDHILPKHIRNAKDASHHPPRSFDGRTSLYGRANRPYSAPTSGSTDVPPCQSHDRTAAAGVVMLRFNVFPNSDTPPITLDGAYVVGSDGVPIRAEITYANGEIRCNKRIPGPSGLCVLWPVPGFGRLMLETTRLVDRDAAYNLHVELARGRLMRISQKREEWGFYDFPDGADYYRRIDAAKAKLVEALTADDDESAARQADAALSDAVIVGEDLSLYHADLFLKRRRSANQFVKRPFGAGVVLNRSDEAYREFLPGAFDFAVLPVPWREMEPSEGKLRWDALDLWVNWLGQHRLHVRAAPLVSLDKTSLPDWAIDVAPNYETFRELVVAHATRMVRRFTHRVQSWECISGVHAFNTFHFSLEQLMDLTRTAALIVKQNAPRSTAIVNVIVPWGEYYARDQRTIPPALYADMCVQSGFNFDAFGLQFQFGAPVEGMLVRDLMQVSSMLDRFGSLGKPIHVTAAQVPSVIQPARNPESAANGGGIWHDPWSEKVQSQWLRQFYDVAFSKPFVETVAWRDLVDGPGRIMPSGGLLHADLTPKPAYQALLDTRHQFLGERHPPHRGRSSP